MIVVADVAIAGAWASIQFNHFNSFLRRPVRAESEQPVRPSAAKHEIRNPKGRVTGGLWETKSDLSGCGILQVAKMLNVRRTRVRMPR